MGKFEKLIAKILSGTSDKNIAFNDLKRLLLILEFEERIKGSHHIFTHENVVEILNLQPSTSGKAKPYQVKQVRAVVLKYKFSDKK